MQIRSWLVSSHRSVDPEETEPAGKRDGGEEQQRQDEEEESKEAESIGDRSGFVEDEAEPEAHETVDSSADRPSATAAEGTETAELES